MTSQQLRLIYLRAIERIIVYAAPFWYSAKSHIKRKLRSIQRIALVKIAKAYRTAPNIALNVISNILPIHLTIEKEVEMYKIMKEDKPFTWEGEAFHGSNIINKIDKWERHPAKPLAFPFSKEISDEDYQFHIFTDGSKSDDKVGAAFVVMDENLSMVDFGQYRLPKYCDNFQAEVVAITKAIEFISSKEWDKVQLITDSLAALQAISNPYNENPMILEVKKLIESNKGKGRIQLAHIKGHSGNSGNELADDFAKTAAEQGQQITISMTKQFIKRKLFAEALDKWQKEWVKEGSGTQTYQWVPNVKNIPSHFPTNHFVSQAVTGHGRFPHYLYRFGIKEDKICRCNEEADSFDHYLDDCPRMISFRGNFKKKLRHQLSKQKQEIIKDEKLTDFLSKMIEEINKIL